MVKAVQTLSSVRDAKGLALPFPAFEKSRKRIAERQRTRSTPTRTLSVAERVKGHAQMIMEKNYLKTKKI